MRDDRYDPTHPRHRELMLGPVIGARYRLTRLDDRLAVVTQVYMGEHERQIVLSDPESGHDICRCTVGELAAFAVSA